ncbi:uncharacterized protein [Montipora capricornis]|uniref:uncharacterized protein n=1 Tax=Montipora capricornis TaxID=246305 RepID=UPI0035F13D6A
MLSSERIHCYLHGLFFRKIASCANAKALVPQNERQTPIEDVLARVLEEHAAVNVRVDPLRSLAETSLVETQDAIQFRATEGPSLIKLKAGPVKRKKGSSYRHLMSPWCESSASEPCEGVWEAWTLCRGS